MTKMLIFKMELFKFYHDKLYLRIAGILAVLNIIVTLQLINAIERMSLFGSTSLITTLALMAVLLLITSGFLVFYYPFRIVSVDYKNNVMSLMLASGVNRRDLFVAKIASVSIISSILYITVFAVPIGIIALNINSSLFNLFSVLRLTTGFNFSQALISAGLQSIYSVVVIIFLSIWLKGSSKSVFAYLGVMFFTGILNSTYVINVNNGNPVIGDIFFYGIAIAVVSYIALRVLQKQSL